MNDPQEHDHRPGLSRRQFLKGSSAVAASALATVPMAPPAIAEEAAPAVPGMGPAPVRLTLNVNGRNVTTNVEPRVTLLDALRNYLDVTGCKRVCDRGTCGACTVLVDDTPRLSCLTLAATVSDRRVDNIESLAVDGRLSAVQRGFHEKLGSQCGYCTPGFIMASAGLLRRNLHPTEDEIRDALGSNICRCTVYVKIIEAVKYAAALCAEGLSP